MRAKIILPNFAAVLVLGLACFFYLRHDLEKKAEKDLRSRMETVRALFVRSESLRGYELLNDLERAAMSKDMVGAFEKLDVPSSRDRPQAEIDAEVRRVWFKKCVHAIQQCLGKAGRSRPDLVVLTDRAGVAVARNITPNACPTGHKLAEGMAVVERALDGESAYSIWSADDSPFSSKEPNNKYCQLMNTGLLELAAAPIWVDDSVVGTLVFGFEMSNGTANKWAQILGVDVARVKGRDVNSSSFDTDIARSSLERQLDSSDVSAKIAAAASGRRSEFFEIFVQGEPYLATAVPVADADSKENIVTLLMGSKVAAKAGLQSLLGILVFMGFALLIVFFVGMILANHFLKPIVEIEDGILKVINGEYGYRFDVKSSEVGGLGYRINQMIGVLTDEEEETSGEE